MVHEACPGLRPGLSRVIRPDALRALQNACGSIPTQKMEGDMDKSEVRSLCEAYRLKGAVTVPEHESKRIIQGYGVSVPRGVLVETVHEAVRFAESVGFPVVVKGVSSEILHKTELQAVALDLRSASVVETACREIQSSFSERKVKTEGLLVEKMVLNGTELIAGLQNDPHF